jgi:hypothetical protein
VSSEVIEAPQNVVAVQSYEEASKKLASVFVSNNLAKLSDEEKSAYYMEVCKTTGLNPATRPFEFMNLGGRVVLYASKGCTDQLRKLYNVSVEIVSQKIVDGICVVNAKALDGTGRTDTDVGAVPVEGLRGEALSNAMMKAITKAKRRVTLSICGLGMLDESEIESIPGAKPVKSVQVVTNPDADSVDMDEVKNIFRQGAIDRLKESFSSYAPLAVQSWYGKHFNKTGPEELSDFELEVAIERVNGSKK